MSLMRRLGQRLPRLRRDAPDKGDAELTYWRERSQLEGTLTGPHYQYLFTTAFGLEPTFFDGERTLDIGCGPRGSLEWATGDCRVGLDPLASRYAEFGITRHTMRYVNGAAEQMPFRSGGFDIITSLNSLDHVDDIDAATSEICRVLRPGGTFLLITETRVEPSPTEPTTFDFDVVDLFAPTLRVVDSQALEKPHQLVHASVLADVAYDPSDTTVRPGILKARLEKRPER